MKLQILILSLAITLTATAQNDPDTEPTTETTSVSETKSKLIEIPIIQLDYGFTIEGEDINVFHEYGVFTVLLVKRNNKLIYRYNNVDEFELEELQNYLFVTSYENEFDLLFEGTSPPSKNWINKLRIKNDSVISISKLPSFESHEKNLDNDSYLELAGYLKYHEPCGSNYDSIAYSPILYYEITDKGLVLDSSLTVVRNTEILGAQYRIDHADDLGQPVHISKRFLEELKRIRSVRK